MPDTLNINDFEALKAWKDKKWVVITPTGQSDLGDILFETSPYDLALQLFGGLERRRVFLVTENKEKAVATAQILIDLQSGAAQDRLAKLEEAVTEAHQYLSTRQLGDIAATLTGKLAMLVEVGKMGWPK
jgi:hypothetical protein